MKNYIEQSKFMILGDQLQKENHSQSTSDSDHIYWLELFKLDLTLITLLLLLFAVVPIN